MVALLRFYPPIVGLLTAITRCGDVPTGKRINTQRIQDLTHE
jgi:hypothetical protein